MPSIKNINVTNILLRNLGALTQYQQIKWIIIITIIIIINMWRHTSQSQRALILELFYGGHISRPLQNGCRLTAISCVKWNSITQYHRQKRSIPARFINVNFYYKQISARFRAVTSKLNHTYVTGASAQTLWGSWHFFPFYRFNYIFVVALQWQKTTLWCCADRRDSSLSLTLFS